MKKKNISSTSVESHEDDGSERRWSEDKAHFKMHSATPANLFTGIAAWV